jgi:hypothetical protein
VWSLSDLKGSKILKESHNITWTLQILLSLYPSIFMVKGGTNCTTRNGYISTINDIYFYHRMQRKEWVVRESCF